MGSRPSPAAGPVLSGSRLASGIAGPTGPVTAGPALAAANTVVKAAARGAVRVFATESTVGTSNSGIEAKVTTRATR